MTRHSLVLLAALALAGCTGSLGGPGDGDVATAEQGLTLGATDAVQIAGILGYELSGLLGEDIAGGGIPGLGDDPPDEDAMPGPGGSTPVGSSDCTDVDWDPANLVGITLTFDNCVLDNGDVLHGAVAVRLQGALGGTLEADLDDLAIGDRFITGPIRLTATPDDIIIDADLNYLDSDTIMSIELEQLHLAIRGDGVRFGGRATIVENGERTQMDLNAVTWSLRSLCHPSSGSIDLIRPGEPPMTILFSADGVELQVGADDPVRVETGCGG